MDTTYTILPNGMVRRGSDTFIPADEGNADYRAFLEWKAGGNEPEVEPELEVLQQHSPSLEDLERRVAALEAVVAMQIGKA